MVERRKPKVVDPRNPNGETVESIRQYFESVFKGFETDPPINMFQEGYAECIHSLWEDFFLTQEQRKRYRAARKAR